MRFEQTIEQTSLRGGEVISLIFKYFLFSSLILILMLIFISYSWSFVVTRGQSRSQGFSLISGRVPTLPVIREKSWDRGS